MLRRRPRSDVLGAEDLVTIRIKNPREFVQKQGWQGAAAAAIIPESQLPSVISYGMALELKKRGADAEVKVISGVPGLPSNATFTRGVVAGAVGVGVMYGLWRFAIKGLFFEKATALNSSGS